MRLNVGWIAILFGCAFAGHCAAAQTDGEVSADIRLPGGGPSGQSVQLTSSNGQPDAATDLPYKYVGNSWSGKFHRPSCPFARAMSAGHVIFFHFRREAIEAGQIPCRYCLPPDWKTVSAKLMPDTRKEPGTEDAQGTIKHQARE